MLSLPIQSKATDMAVYGNRLGLICLDVLAICLRILA